MARRLESCARYSFRRSLRGLVAACWLATSGCADSKPGASEPPPGEAMSWVGNVTDSDVTVGIAASGSLATLFFCGGGSSYATRTHWFQAANWSSADFSLQDQDFRVSGVTRAGQIEGTVEFGDAEPLAFIARAPEPATLAGVYDALGPCGHAGLIVLQSAADSDSEAQGTCLRREGAAVIVEQVNPVQPLTRDANRAVLVEAESAPGESFLLHPLSP